jgi:hypothetical protein
MEAAVVVFEKPVFFPLVMALRDMTRGQTPVMPV